jgi:uncharacterized protein (DUF427 family)
MPVARWNGEIIAESDHTEIVEGNHYFPPESVREEYLRPSEHTTFCGWKGDAAYYTLRVKGEENENAAWYYPQPYDAAAQIKDYVAFYPSVEVTA